MPRDPSGGSPGHGSYAAQLQYVELCSEERGVPEREGEVKGVLVGGG